ncbi:hypothetical protein F2P81_008092 [Scophthalmus maximus]|uniref:Uncharacterized protein n=1 Tax=Scophthalmus maximus TaxID=52904 RepID=A0A6A4T1C5_SCOMX|nr:hypothetical protein F2P81_008092 [Scophthalmus maximus]
MGRAALHQQGPNEVRHRFSPCDHDNVKLLERELKDPSGNGPSTRRLRCSVHLEQVQHVAKPGFGLDSHRCRKRNEGNVVQYNKQLRDIRYKRHRVSSSFFILLNIFIMKAVLLLTVLLSGVLAITAAAVEADEAAQAPLELQEENQVEAVEPAQAPLELQEENQVAEIEVGVAAPEVEAPEKSGEMALSVKGRFFACPTGWVRYKNSCYLYVSTGKSWSSAAGWRWVDQSLFNYNYWNSQNSVSSYPCIYLNARGVYIKSRAASSSSLQHQLKPEQNHHTSTRQTLSSFFILLNIFIMKAFLLLTVLLSGVLAITAAPVEADEAAQAPLELQEENQVAEIEVGVAAPGVEGPEKSGEAALSVEVEADEAAQAPLELQEENQVAEIEVGVAAPGVEGPEKSGEAALSVEVEADEAAQAPLELQEENQVAEIEVGVAAPGVEGPEKSGEAALSVEGALSLNETWNAYVHVI